MARKLVVEIIGETGSLDKAFGSASRSAQSFGDRLGSSMKNVGKHMAIAGAAITGVAVIVGKKLVDSALAAEVSEAKLEKSFDNAGLSAKKYTEEITKAEDAGRELGFTNTETRDSLAKLVQGGDTVKQSMKDLGLAQDYARVTGKDLATATGAIVKVHQGLLRPLKELGISLPQATDHMKALTEAHKKSGDAITYNEKALALQQDKQETGAKAVQLMTETLHGQADAFSRTSAGGMAAFQAQLENLQETLGTLLLPFLDKAVGILNQVTAALSKLSPETKKLIVDIGLAVAAFGAVMLVLGPVIAGIGTLLPVFIALASPIGIVVAALVLLVAALAAAVLWPDKLQAALQKMGLSAKTSKEIVDDLRNSFTAIKAVVQTVWPVIQAVIVPALQVIKGLLMIVSGILRGDFSEAWKGVKIVVVNELKFMLAAVTAMPKLVLRAALAIGAAILQGIGQGLKDLGPKVHNWLSKIGGELATIASEVPAWAAGIGRAIVSGIISGITGLPGQVKDAIVSGVKWGISHALPTFQHSPQEVIGIALVDGVIRGWNQKSAGIDNAMVTSINATIDRVKMAIQNKQSVFAAAFDVLVSSALDAFDKLTGALEEKIATKAARLTPAEKAAKGETPAEKQLRIEQEQRDAAARQQAIQDAQTAVAKALTAQGTLVQGKDETWEDFAARQQAAAQSVIDAQRTLDDALFAEHTAQLQKQADAERTAADKRATASRNARDKEAAAQTRALDDSRELRRKHFGEQLTDLEKQLSTGRISAKTFRDDVIKLFDKFDVPFKNVGHVLGSALTEALNEAFGDAAAAAVRLVNAIAAGVRKLEMVVSVSIRPSGNPTHRQHGGAVRRNNPYIVGEAGPELFSPNTSGRISPLMAGGMGASAEIHTHVYLDSTQIAEVVRREYLRFEKRNGRAAL